MSAEECVVNDFSSRVCELGTKSCFAKHRPPTICPKCGAVSGDDWEQCEGSCPLRMSPHYDPALEHMLMRPSDSKGEQS